MRRTPIGKAASPSRRQLEGCKVKSRRDRASHQRPVAGALGCLPGMRRHDGLRYFAGGEIGTELNAATVVAIGDLKKQRAAGVIMPDLDSIDAMPMGPLIARQQEIDRSRARTSIGVAARVTKRFAIMAAFRMRLEAEPGDEIGGGDHQDLFLRSRNSPNTSALTFAFHPHAGGDRRLIGAQEHVGLLFLAERYRNGRLIGGAQPRHFLGARLQRRIVRLDGQREFDIGRGIFVAAIQFEIIGQHAQFEQQSHICG